MIDCQRFPITSKDWTAIDYLGLVVPVVLALVVWLVCCGCVCGVAPGAVSSGELEHEEDEDEEEEEEEEELLEEEGEVGESEELLNW